MKAAVLPDADVWYAVAYMPFKNRGVSHGWVWAAWHAPTAPSPSNAGWVVPCAVGEVAQVWGTPTWGRGAHIAEAAADEIGRALFLGARDIPDDACVRSVRIDDGWARAADRARRDHSPNYRAPRPTQTTYAKPLGWDLAVIADARAIRVAFRARVCAEHPDKNPARTGPRPDMDALVAAKNIALAFAGSGA